MIAYLDVNSEARKLSVEPRGITLDAPMLLVTLKGPLFKRFCLVRSQRASAAKKRIALDGQALLKAPRDPFKRLDLVSAEVFLSENLAS